MAKRLYVGNLPYGVADDDLRNLFSQAGTVEEATVMTERETGRSRGFGFVEMSNDADAENAIRMFDGYTMEGRQLRVNPAMEREERGAGGFRRGTRGGY
ncbi:MAG: RNA recognition motif domain-containing protein [Chloroflexota bacterium]|jgi:cold-inducible RNA-binding protein